MFLLLPFWTIPLLTIMLILVSIEAGYLIGVFASRLGKQEKESPVSVISGAILGLLSFLLAFTFGILYGRFDARKELVRREANAIETTFLRADFMSHQDRGYTIDILKAYVALRLELAHSLDVEVTERNFKKSDSLQQQVWRIAVKQSREGRQSSFQVVQAVNDMIEIQNLRIARGYQAKTPTSLWLSLYALLVMSMMSIGYQVFVSGSNRSIAILILTISFTLVFSLLIALEQPRYGFFRVNQQPLVNVQKLINNAGFASMDSVSTR